MVLNLLKFKNFEIQLSQLAKYVTNNRQMTTISYCFRILNILIQIIEKLKSWKYTKLKMLFNLTFFLEINYPNRSFFYNFKILFSEFLQSFSITYFQFTKNYLITLNYRIDCNSNTGTFSNARVIYLLKVDVINVYRIKLI